MKLYLKTFFLQVFIVLVLTFLSIRACVTWKPILYDLELRWDQKVVMDDVFYGHCEGHVSGRSFDSDGIPHYYVNLTCRSVTLRNVDWTLYKIRKYNP